MQKRKFFYWLTISNFLYIVILLILAGVSINLVLGPNGLIAKAQEAALKTDEASLNEKVQMAIVAAQMEENEYKELTAENLGYELIKDGTKAVVSENEDGTIHILFLDEKKEYRLNSEGNIEDLNIDFDAKYVAPESQDEERNNGVIGIGTDGKPVDMDLWEYTYIKDTDSYALNDSEVINTPNIENKGYLGKFESNGEIEGSIPMYIKSDKGQSYKPVTDMNNTFRDCSELIIAPEIPKTVTEMFTTFNSCINLKKAPILPPKLVNMYGLFYNCNSLEYVPKIPNTVKNMAQSFVFCKKIEIISEIPEGVINLRGAFGHCTSLQTVSCNIPSTVEDMKETFVECTNLQGRLIIDANPSVYTGCFMEAATNGKGLTLSGDCTMLLELINTKSLNSKITL